MEAQLALYGLPYTYEEVGDVFVDAAARDALAKVNPLAQVPTLVLPDGRVMTESAAITLFLADVTGSDALEPDPAAPERAEFLRWLVYLVANVYPTFTYADDPARFVEVEAARKPFRAAVDAYGTRLWTHVEAAARSPWFLGERASALDVYVGVMTRWRPRRAWFAANAPKLHAIADATDAMTALAPIWSRNFPTAA